MALLSGTTMTSMGQKDRTVLFCLDGGSWNVITPLVERGELPNIARLIHNGTSGTLRSVDPSISPSIWTTIATGKRPEEHGIINFYNLQQDLKSKRIWEIFEDQEKVVGVAGYFMTWPPMVRRGFMIPDHFAPGPETTPKDLSFFQDLTIYSDRRTKLKPHQALRYTLAALRNGCRPGTLLNAAQVFLQKKFLDLSYLDSYPKEQLLYLRFLSELFVGCTERYDPNLLVLYFPGTDTLAHKYWHYHDPSHFPGVDRRNVMKYGSVINDHYKAVDQAIGSILKHCGPDSQVFIVSDHGFRAEEGFEYRYRVRMDVIMRNGGLAERFQNTNLGNQTILHPLAATGKEREALIERGRSFLESCRLEESKEPLFEVETFSHGIGYHVRWEFKRPIDDETVVVGESRYRVGDIVSESTIWSGDHSVEGIIIAHGHGIRKGVHIEQADVIDITPTILALSALPLGEDMEGKVLCEAMEETFLRSNPVKRIPSYGPPNASDFTTQLSMDEEERLNKKLQGLGYLD